MSKLLSVIVPIYNEEDTLVQLLDRLFAVDFKRDLEVIAVNDGSSDGSLMLLANYQKEHPGHPLNVFSIPHGGKGAAVRCGVKKSRGDVVIVQDADLEYNPQDIVRCVEPIFNGEAEVVYGSRELERRPHGKSSWLFYLGGRTVTFCFNLLFGTKLTDEPCCYKAFGGDLIRTVGFRFKGFGWEPEISAKIVKLGLEIHEVGASYDPRPADEHKKIKWTDGIWAILVMVYMFFCPLFRERRELAKHPQYYGHIKSQQSIRNWLIAIFIIAFGIRLVIAFPSLMSPEGLLRPDSASYLNFREVLLHGDSGGIPLSWRVPIYGLMATGLEVCFGKSLQVLAIFGILFSALTAVLCAKCGGLIGGKGALIIAGLLLALNPTSIGTSPQILADALFGLLVAWQGWYMLKVWKSGRVMDYGKGVFFAVVATLVKPINLPIALLCLPFCARVNLPKVSNRVWAYALTLIFAAGCFLPQMALNNSRRAGWVLDSNTGNTLLNNATAIKSRAEGRDFLAVQRELFELSMSGGTTVADIERNKREIHNSIVLKYPGDAFVSYLPHPVTLIPDIPAMLESLQLSVSGKGTYSIIKSQGILAGVGHYFAGTSAWHLTWIIPAILVALVTYSGAVLQIFSLIRERQWRLVFTCLALTLPYWALPGPMFMPRYQLPMLIILCALAGAFISSKKNPGNTQ